MTALPSQVAEAGGHLAIKRRALSTMRRNALDALLHYQRLSQKLASKEVLKHVVVPAGHSAVKTAKVEPAIASLQGFPHLITS
jgi:hypothetical protein